jgi:hypothetical protein
VKEKHNWTKLIANFLSKPQQQTVGKDLLLSTLSAVSCLILFWPLNPKNKIHIILAFFIKAG